MSYHVANKVDKVRQRISLPDGYSIHVCSEGQGALVRINLLGPCNHTGEVSLHKGRLWYINPDMSDDAIVRTIFAAYKMFLMHEASEQFKYGGKAIFEHSHG